MNSGKHLEYLFVPHELTYGMVLNCGDPAGVGSGSGVSTSIIIYIGVCGNFRHVSLRTQYLHEPVATVASQGMIFNIFV